MDETRFYVERLANVRTVPYDTDHHGQAWLPVGHIDWDGNLLSHRHAFVGWVGEQTPEPAIGYYRILERGSDGISLLGTEFEIREHRERVIEQVQHPQVARDIETLSRAGLTPAGEGK